MAGEAAALKVTRDLKAAVSAILQGYGGGHRVTDASAELHGLCGCLERLLQFDQKQQKSFLRPQKDYWDFFCSALRQQRGDAEPVLFVHSQAKLKTPLGKGRAFIRFCLAHGQLAECLQLCLLSTELTRSRCSNSSRTQGRPRKTKDSPKEISTVSGGPKGVQPEEAHTSQASCLRDAPGEDRLAGLLTSQQHGHLPPFLEKKKEDPGSLRAPHSMREPEREKLQQDQEMGSPRSGICLEHSAPSIPGLRERANQALKEVVETEGEGQGAVLSTEGPRTTEGTQEREAEWGHDQGLLVSSPRGTNESSMSRNRQENKEPSILGEASVLRGLGTKEGSTTEKPQEHTGVTGVARKEEQAEVALQDVVKTLRHRLQKTKEQALHQEQLLKEQERELKALQEQLSRCQEERAGLQAALEQRQQEAERRGAVYEEELAGQRDLIRAMKRRVLELIQEKDNLWQKVQQLSSMAPGCCVSCSKLFGRLSRRYPCRLCGGLVCHACSLDYKKQERRCPPCAQKGEAQVV
ncbi:RUN and FYVE domain-containing protein 4 isoform X2 [Pipistrellus kuhlii]|uniref:RUN and FYVE domain-containing protein 4 isoform X2 n=1 Tax=Pipistrellus kuhlii TaxID=59472 RepID=UPI001E26F296|nr:RUN and FYVE domain-containing protein 4 isoform X2 [Pipistrellus kuhlii]